MVRAYRFFLPGYIWHITQRCHKKEFLLKFSRDRKRWLFWLFQAKKRYGLRVLNYMVTSNHVHLLVFDEGRGGVIPRSLQLAAGRTGQEYNQRKERRGAFWEDRYHATAVESDSHLIQCLVYIDLNMVRAGIVNHPSEWHFCGYNEIQNVRERYRLMDYTRLIKLFNISTMEKLKILHKDWVDEALERKNNIRESRWTESIAVGSQSFIETIKTQLGFKGRYRIVEGGKGTYELREESYPYVVNSSTGKVHLRAKNE